MGGSGVRGFSAKETSRSIKQDDCHHHEDHDSGGLRIEHLCESLEDSETKAGDHSAHD